MNASTSRHRSLLQNVLLLGGLVFGVVGCSGNASDAGDSPEETADGLAWLRASGGQVPNNALVGGAEQTGQTLFLCRAAYAGGVHPGKLRSEFGGCNLAYGGVELVVASYEVPTTADPSALAWYAQSGGQIPSGAVQGGHEEDGEPLYVCRASYAGGVHPGKVRPAFGGCNIGYGGVELALSDYQVLIAR